MLQILLLLLLPGVLSKEWNVNYPPPICAARGSNVTVNCTFIKKGQVKQVMWCSMNSNFDVCVNGPYVYDSGTNKTQNNFQYIGDKKSNCSLLINNINQTDSGEYRFRIITDFEKGKWTGQPGIKISVDDLKVSISKSRINRSIRSGDSLNLTCSLDCSGNLTEVQWFKNGELMKQTNPNLIFSNISANDSGNYACSLRTFTNTLSEEVSIHIEDADKLLTLLIIIVSSILLIFIIAAVILIIRCKAKTPRKPKEVREETSVTQDNIYQTTEVVDEPTDEEVQYASVEPKKLNDKSQEQISATTEQQDESVIYSTVKTA